MTAGTGANTAAQNCWTSGNMFEAWAACEETEWLGNMMKMQDTEQTWNNWHAHKVLWGVLIANMIPNTIKVV